VEDSGVPEVSVTEAANGQATGAVLVDVREPDEWTEVHATGAQLIPLGEVVDRLDEVPRTGTVFVICRSGARSARAAEFYRANGVDAVNVAGGTLAWVAAGLPVLEGDEPR
jgi:rhodanese-related sulfurtransferase